MQRHNNDGGDPGSAYAGTFYSDNGQRPQAPLVQ